MKQQQYMTWEQAFRAGFSIVTRSNRLSDSVEEDLRLSGLAARALLIGAHTDWILENLSKGADASLNALILKHTH